MTRRSSHRSVHYQHMKLPESPRLITMLVWSGVATWVLLMVFICLMVTVGVKGLSRGDFKHWLEGTFDASMQDAGLGEEGSICGSELRLPCNPGLVCEPEEGEEGPEAVGTCVSDDQEAVAPGREGEVCNAVRGCVPRLVCNRAGRAAGVCIKPSRE